jgi:hypothetical protein
MSMNEHKQPHKANPNHAQKPGVAPVTPAKLDQHDSAGADKAASNKPAPNVNVDKPAKEAPSAGKH